MKKIRVLMSKIGLDGHEVGAKVVSAMLREAGMEVVYLGKFQTPEMILVAAIEEGVDVIGISCQTPNHVRWIPKLMGLLKEEGLNDMVVLVGGIIPDPYPAELKAVGVDLVFGPGTMSADIVSAINTLVAEKVEAVNS